MNMNDVMGTKDGSTTKDQEAAEKAKAEQETDPKSEDKKVADSTEDDSSVEEKDPYADWTRDEIIKEMRSSRQEAAKNRVDKKETEKALLEEADAKVKAIEEKFAPFIKKAAELDKLKEREADQKRTDAEKLAAREARIDEILLEKENISNKAQEKEQQLQVELEKAKAEVEAYQGYWKEQLEKELDEVPEKHKNLANMIVKGAGETKEALDAIKQAKSDNLFGVKKVSVYNATPTAKDGARLDSNKVQRQASDKLSAKGKIGEGLKKFKDRTRRRLQGE